MVAAMTAAPLRGFLVYKLHALSAVQPTMSETTYQEIAALTYTNYKQKSTRTQKTKTKWP